MLKPALNHFYNCRGATPIEVALYSKGEMALQECRHVKSILALCMYTDIAISSTQPLNSAQPGFQGLHNKRPLHCLLTSYCIWVVVFEKEKKGFFLD